jgi:hypothetical protein
LLSIDEVVRFFGDSGQMNNRPSNMTSWISDMYDNDRKAYFEGRERDWWLRSSEPDGIGPLTVTGHGYIHMSSTSVFLSSIGVRPALWLKL